MHPEISFTQRVAVPPETLVRVVDGELVILSLKTETYFGLDEVGTRFWAHLAESPTIEAACDRLADEFEASLETIRRDMREFVEALHSRGLISVPGA